MTGPLGEVVNPAGIRTIGEFPNLTAAMERARWPEAKIRKGMGEDWCAFWPRFGLSKRVKVLTRAKQ